LSTGCLIFIMGRQRAGKDTAADYLVNYYGFTKVPLAKPVYEIACRLFAMVGKERGLLIDIGTKMREIDIDVFPKAVWREAVGCSQGAERILTLPPGTRIVVPDTRFPNEWEFFKQRGAWGIRVMASQKTRASRPGYDAEFESDPTETSLEDAPADAVITNEGTYGAFYDALDCFLTQKVGLKREG
jgi:hypothetical protein